jgi:transcriptional regulator with XRE-family HTH domain
MLGRPTPLDDLLRASGVTRAEVERRGGVSPMTLSRWRRGIGWPQYAAVKRLAQALGRDMGEVTDAIVDAIAAARAERTAPTPQNKEPRT